MSGRETTHQERVEIVQKHLEGNSLRAIAEAMRLDRYTVRGWWRAYRDGGWETLQLKRYARPKKGLLSTFDPLVRYAALRMKWEHPGWGPDVLLYKLGQRPSLAGKELPSRSALAAYLSPYLPRIRGKRQGVLQRSERPAVTRPQCHEVWQVDFKGAEAVGKVGKVAPLVVVDQASSAPLRITIYPGSLKGVTWRDIQRELRAAFSEWGLPDFIRMDRDPLFVGSPRLEWPGSLLQWLVGVGVLPIINDPHRPTQNAQIERQNRTWMEHVALGANYADITETQHATDLARHERLAVLPSRNGLCHGKPPLVACPHLCIPRRPFDPARELDLFDFERVELYFSDWRWRRTVDKTGCFSLADHNIHVGAVYHKQTVEIVYDLSSHMFVARSYNDTRAILCQFTLPVVSPAYITGLDSPTEVVVG